MRKNLVYHLPSVLIIVVLLISLALPQAAAQSEGPPQTGSPAERAQALLETLQPREKIGQLLLVTFKGQDVGPDSQIYDLITKHYISGVILQAANDNFIGPEGTVNAAWNLIRQLQIARWDGAQVDVVDNLGLKLYTPAYIPLFIGVNQEGDGPPYSEIFNGLTPLPNQMAIGATWQTQLAEDVGQVLGQELSSLGFNLLFGPSLDILENPNPEGPGDLGTRTFSGDPFWVGEMAKAYISGIHKGSQSRIAVVGKYFPGRGGSDRSPEVEVATIRKSLDQLKQIELTPFFAVTGSAPNLESTVDALLTSHIRYQGFQGNIRTTTRPISFDPQAFNLLMGLDPLKTWRDNGGVMVSDNLSNQAVRLFYDPTGQTYNASLVARDALLAGNDLLYLGNLASNDKEDAYSTIIKIIDFFEQKYREDTAFAKRVDRAVLRILTLKYRLYGDFSLLQVLTPEEGLQNIGTGTQVAFEVAQNAATLISPSPSELDNQLPTPPKFNDRIVFITQTEEAMQCSKCPPQPIMAVDALQQAVIRLFGQGPGAQIHRQDLISFSSAKLREMLDAGRGSTELEFYLRQARWIVFSMLVVHSSSPDSIALRRFLTERPDLISGKQVIVIAFNAPYYLDATDISKLSAYYGLYSKGPQFVDVAASLLFNELRPIPGAPPVSVPGIGYDLISVISPDPSQTIPLFLDTPQKPETSPEATLEGGVQANYEVGDLVPVRTGVILDYNGHPVPDNTPVHFLLTSTGEKGALLEEIVTPTTGGVARATFSIKSPGILEVSAKSESAVLSQVIRLDVAGEPLPTEIPTQDLTETPQPTLTPTIAPLPFNEDEATGKHHTSLALLSWFLAVVFGGSISWFVYRLEINKGQVRAGMRAGLLTFISGLVIYTYVMLELPGLDWLVKSMGYWAGIPAMLMGNGIGYLVDWTFIKSPPH